MKRRVLPLAVVLLAAVACTPDTTVTQAAPPHPAAVTSESTVTYSVHLTPGECHARDNGTLPDSRCTPGATDPHVTQATIRTTICKTGWTATVRPPTSQANHAKFTVSYPAYSVPPRTSTEEDHSVSLELGGSSDIINLWPESYPEARIKDVVENALHAAVCSGKTSLAAAQKAIASNWKTARQQLGLQSRPAIH